MSKWSQEEIDGLSSESDRRHVSMQQFGHYQERLFDSDRYKVSPPAVEPHDHWQDEPGQRGRAAAADAVRGPVLHMHPHQALGVIQAGEYRTLHHPDIQDSNGSYSPDYRRSTESLFGWNHPVYAGIGREDQVLNAYGKVRMHVDPKHWDRTTITAGDSLGQNPTVMPAVPLRKLINDPNPRLPGGYRTGYKEAQIDTDTGTLPLSDFTRAEVPSPGNPARYVRGEGNPDEVAEALASRGMPVTRASRAEQPPLADALPLGPPSSFDENQKLHAARMLWTGGGGGLADTVKLPDLVESQADYKRRTGT